MKTVIVSLSLLTLAAGGGAGAYVAFGGCHAADAPSACSTEASYEAPSYEAPRLQLTATGMEDCPPGCPPEWCEPSASAPVAAEAECAPKTKCGTQAEPVARKAKKRCGTVEKSSCATTVAVEQ